MKVLDTATMPSTDRAEAFQDVVSANSTVSLASFEDAHALRAEMHVFDMGQAKVFNIESTGTTLKRTAQAAREMNDHPIACALPTRTTNFLNRDDGDRAFGPRDLILVDLASPYTYSWSGAGASYAFHVEYDDLGIPMDTIRRAITDPRSSPLYPMVRDHILRVTSDADAIEASGAASDVGAATIELMRALIVSAAGDEPGTRHSMHETMFLRVQHYVREHLRDPDLSPEQVAAANAISVRTLYNLYQRQGTSLGRSIVEQRMRGAYADLARPALGKRTIAAVARSWGFSNASSFSTRFSQQFGMTPREWRHRNLS